jgi:tripartite-type tricarboxylate transporter receptor subunit TctC
MGISHGMLRQRVLLLAAAAMTLAACGGGGDQEEGDSVTAAAGAESYPCDKMTYIVPYGPGGSTDPLSREFVKHLEPLLETSIVVRNQPGAAAAVGTEMIANAEPDGCTIGLSGSTLMIAPYTDPDLVYTDMDNIAPLGKFTTIKYILAVQPDAPWKSCEELIKDAQSRPGEITVSTPGTLNPGDLALAQLNNQTDGAFRAVPFSGGGGEAMTALLGGQVDVAVAAPRTAIGQVEAGEIRPLCVLGSDVNEAFPDAPPISEAGYEITIGSDLYLIAPADIPDDTFKMLTDASYEALTNGEFIEYIESTGSTPAPLTAEEAREDIVQQRQAFQETLEFLDENGMLPAG